MVLKAIGRVIRNKDDWGSIMLVDSRYVDAKTAVESRKGSNPNYYETFFCIRLLLIYPNRYFEMDTLFRF